MAGRPEALTVALERKPAPARDGATPLKVWHE